MIMEIIIVKTFCDFGQNVLKKTGFLAIFIRILAIKLRQKSASSGT